MSNSSTMLTTGRILIFSLAYYPEVGGAEIAIKEITDRLPHIEFDMITLALNQSSPRFEKVGNVNVYRVGGGLGYLSKIIFVPRASVLAWRLRRVRGYDLYWAIMTYMLFPITLLRLVGDKTSYVLTLQDGDPFRHVFNRWFILPFKPLLLHGFRRAKMVQAISQYLADWARDAGARGSVEVIPNGVSLDKFRNNESRIMNQEKIILVTVSRLVEKNGVEDIVEAMKFLPENIVLNIIGTGPRVKNIIFKIKNLKLEERVNLVGNVSNESLPEYLSHADIFIRPSISEGQGIAFLEAMSAGLPVIATPVGGIPDFLKDRETGLFVPVRSPEAIAEKVLEYINNSELREGIIRRARAMMESRYDWNLIVREIESKVFR